MNQVKEMQQSRIVKVIEGLKMVFSELSVNNDIVEDPEEVVKKSGIKELVSNERIKNIESIFEEHGTSIKQVREKLKSEEKNNAPQIKNSIISVNTQDLEEDLER